MTSLKPTESRVLDGDEPKTEEEKVRHLTALRNFQNAQQELQILASNIATMETTVHEHEKVLEILLTQPKDRRCWYSIEGILAEMTVDKVIPKLKNKMVELKQEIKKRTTEVEEKRVMLTDYAIKEKLVKLNPKMLKQQQLQKQNIINKSKLQSIKE